MRARLQAVFENPLSGDRLRGRIRLLGVVLVIFILGWIGCFHFEDLETQDIIAGWRSHYRLLKLVPIGLMNSLIVFGRGLRYYFLVFMAFAAAFLIGARYIQDIYKLGGFSLAIQYLGALLFAFGYPRLTIEAGEAQIPPGETNLLDAIGGPGYLIINPGSLVLLESVDGAPRICAAGVNFVTRREKIREIVNLDDRHGYIESVETFTKDGIRVRVRDIHFRYRLRTGSTFSERARQNRDNPNPFSYQAVLDMAYQRSVRSDGITPWHDLVKIAVDAAVTDYIRAHRFDDLTAPRFNDVDPRDKITNKLNSEGTKHRLKGVGAELLWADMGHFETVDEQVDQQRLETWGAKWIGNAEVQRAFGEARRISYQEFGRAEAQAEMLVSIMEALDDTDWPEDADEDERVRNIILTRTAQILDGMADRDFSTNRQSDDFPPPVSENRG